MIREAQDRAAGEVQRGLCRNYDVADEIDAFGDVDDAAWLLARSIERVLDALRDVLAGVGRRGSVLSPRHGGDSKGSWIGKGQC